MHIRWLTLIFAFLVFAATYYFVGAETALLLSTVIVVCGIESESVALRRKIEILTVRLDAAEDWQITATMRRGDEQELNWRLQKRIEALTSRLQMMEDLFGVPEEQAQVDALTTSVTVRSWGEEVSLSGVSLTEGQCEDCAAFSDERNRELATLASFEAECAHAAAQSPRIETEEVPLVYMGEWPVRHGQRTIR
jgi:hypothetical protein